ncbi:MAG: hypothetical protein AAGF97_14825, partial [Planctomycetota bacterium]
MHLLELLLDAAVRHPCSIDRIRELAVLFRELSVLLGKPLQHLIGVFLFLITRLAQLLVGLGHTGRGLRLQQKTQRDFSDIKLASEQVRVF